jgi:hypothetical protein
MRPRKLRRLLALMLFGGILAGTGVGWATDAHASPETDYLTALNSVGIVIYDTQAALNTGYAICGAFNTTRGDVVAENLYRNTSFADIPTRDAAAAWVVVAGTTLCPWHYHPERTGYVA